MFSNCGTGEDSWESLGLQGDQTSQSILKEINPEYWLEGLMLNLKLQYFGYQMLRADSLKKTLMLVKIEKRGQQRIKWWMASLTQWTWIRANCWKHWRTGKPGILQSKSQTWLSNWTTTCECILKYNDSL